MIRRLFLSAALAVLPLVTAAGELVLPAGARVVSERISPMDSYALPIAPFDGQSVPVRLFEGRVERHTWKIGSGAVTTLQLLAPLREQIEADGYDILFDCAARDCGGFDFRFGIEVVPAPDMHVNLGNFRFLSAQRGPNEALGLLISRTVRDTYIQLIRTTPADTSETEPLKVVSKGEPLPIVDAGKDAGLAQQLRNDGHAVLGDLDFGSGAAALGAGPYPSLVRLATYLNEHPTHRIAVVGHTDSIGQLGANVSLSKKRARAVRKRLIDRHGIDGSRIEAEGMGYLAPVGSNLSEAGREANRRVEVILLSGE